MNDFIPSKFQEIKNEQIHSFASVVGKYYLNKEVEILLNQEEEVINYTDHNKYVYVSIVGKVLDSAGDCIVVEISNKQIIMVNGYSVLGITETSSNLKMNSIISITRKS